MQFKTEIMFNSLPEFLTELREQKQRKYSGAKIAFLRSLENMQDASWTGGIKGFEDGDQFLENGFLPFVDQVKAEAAAQVRESFSLVPSVCGEFYDVGAYLQGRPDCMAEITQDNPVRFLDIVVNTGVSCDMSGKELMKRAAALYSLIDSAEAQGIKVNLQIIAAVKPPVDLLVSVNVKQYNDRLNPALFGFVLGHAGFLRCYLFAYLSLISKRKSIGAPADYTPKPGQLYIAFKDLTPEQIKNALD
jgi:hypothetical protein